MSSKDKCDICGKFYKSVATHKRMAHPTSPATAQNDDEIDWSARSGMRGEIGRIQDIAQHSPVRAHRIYDTYIKGRQNAKRDLILSKDSNKVLGWQPIGEDEI